MRPITAAIGRAPTKITKSLVKPLSGCLGKIIGPHLRVQDINFSGKKMVSCDVKALFTNVTVVAALESVAKVVGVKGGIK